MPAKRRTPTCRHPLFLLAAFTLGIASIFAVLVASLAQAHASPLTAAAALRQGAGQAYFAQAPLSQGDVAAGEPAIEYTPGVVLVKLKAAAAQSLAQPGMSAVQGTSADAARVATLFQSYGVSTGEPLFPAASAPSGYSAQAARSGDDTPLRVYKLHLVGQLDARQIAAALASDANVEYAEPDYIARGIRVPNDPEYGAQWALAKIGAPAAWDLQTGSPDVVIAVVDSGVDTAHPEFSGRLWENDDPLDGVDNDLNGYVDDLHGWNVAGKNNDIGDANGHGTQVAGVLGAAADNGQGIAGLCWGCKLMFVNAMQADGIANYSDIARAVIYASSNGAAVINLALGGYADSAVLHDAIREAATTTVIVGGAGNDDSEDAFYPAAYPEVLAVAATDEYDQKAIFSNHGTWVDLSAPGANIRTTMLSGGYADESGTSLATAYVAGLAGLVKSQHPAWTPAQVMWQIRNTSVSIDATNPTLAGKLGRGRIDAAAALANNPQAQAVVAGYTLDRAANARPAPGQSFQLVLAVQNQWLPAQNLQGTLTSSNPNVTITDPAGSFGDIGPGQSGSNSGDPFDVTVSGAATYNAVLSFTLALRGDGGYSLDLPFTLQVRSAVETLGNTQYSQDTTWTSDKTYVLAGSVIVGQGVTLTIQPGTVVKADPSKFIRIDGTLIALGTAEQPIIFTTNSTTGATWSGIRFTASAANAVLAEDGSYAGGSTLRHVEVSSTDVGLSLAGRTPYIADSTFTGSGLAIQTWADGAPGGRVSIERNRFVGNGIDVGGGAAVTQNDFSGGGNCGIKLRSGSPLLLQNSLNDGCNIGGNAAYPNVVSNTLLGGAITLSLSGSNGSGQATLPAFLQNARAEQLAAGSEHTCALMEGGSVRCWGSNTSGQLGTGSSSTATTPQAVIALTGGVVQLVAGAYHTCALLQSGSVQCWGRNDMGQLGTGNNDNFNTPQIVTGLAGAVKHLAASVGHTCALIEDGSVQCWGNNYYGQLGTGSNDFANLPRAVIGLAGAARQLTAGNTHTCALLESGTVQCWGDNWLGQLGTGNNVNATTPQAVVGLGGIVRQLSAGASHTCALLENAAVQCWGNNGPGQLGTGTTIDANTPQTVIGLTGAARQLAAGGLHTCALLESGSVQCWGNNSWGQLGTGTSNDRATTAQAVIGLTDAAYQVTTGYAHTCALLASGSVQCWGSNNSGQFGTGSSNDTANTPLDTAPALTHVSGNSVHRGGGLSLSVGAGNWRVQQNAIFASTGDGVAFSCSDCRAIVSGNTIAGSQGSGIQLGGGGWLQVAGNIFANNEGQGIAVIRSGDTEVVTNTIASNRGYGLQFGGSGVASARVQQNNLVGNGAYEIYLESGTPGTLNITLDAANNYWSVPSASIPGRIRDCTFDENGCGSPSATLGRVAFAPALPTPQQTAPAFATALILEPDTVGVEAGTLVVEFSKPMATAILPKAQFQLAPDQPQYLFENGRWISSTRYEATFDFTAMVASGYYTVTVEDAVDGDGMPAYAAKANAFRVYFGAGVTLDPPVPPIVTAQTTGSLSNLAASWTAGGPTIDQYRYAIGTTPGARNIVGWTYLVSKSFARSDLNLIQGQTYYVTVQAHSSNGMWSLNGLSNGIVAGQAPTPNPTPNPTPTVAPFIQPGTGGTQTGQLGDINLSLSVPANAISEPIGLVMQSVTTPPATGGLTLLGQSFAINAQTAGGAPVTQFATPLTLVIHYTDAAAAGVDESRLQLFYWKEAQQQWIGIPTIIDAQANTLTVYLDHLTLFAALEAEARSPNLYLPQIRR